MDPVTCLKMLLGAFVENETTPNADSYARAEAIEALENLTEWLRKGGAMPKVLHDREYDSYHVG